MSTTDIASLKVYLMVSEEALKKRLEKFNSVSRPDRNPLGGNKTVEAYFFGQLETIADISKFITELENMT